MFPFQQGLLLLETHQQRLCCPLSLAGITAPSVFSSFFWKTECRTHKFRVQSKHPPRLPQVIPSGMHMAASRSTRRSTHARPGMHMQQCSAVLLANTPKHNMSGGPRPKWPTNCFVINRPAPNHFSSYRPPLWQQLLKHPFNLLSPLLQRGGRDTCEIWKGEIWCQENWAPSLRYYCKIW